MPDPSRAWRAWLKWLLFFALVMAVGLVEMAMESATGVRRQRIASGPPTGALDARRDRPVHGASSGDGALEGLARPVDGASA